MNAQEEYDCGRTDYWFDTLGSEYLTMTPSQKKNAKRKYKESAMNSTTTNINAPAPVTEADVIFRERVHLASRAYQAFSKRREDARRTFGLDDDKFPLNPQELVDRIKSGMYVLPEKWDPDRNTNPVWFINEIRWRDPAKTEDRDGYAAAKKVLDAEYRTLQDSVEIKDPEVALTELQAWENATTQ